MATTSTDRLTISHVALGWLAVFVLALAIRVLYLSQIESHFYFHHLVGDAAGYDEWGQRLANGEWWRPETFYQAPLYPYFLGAVYKFLGHDILALRVVQCVLGAIGCVLVGLAADRFFSRRVGLVAGVLMAAYPPAIYFDGIVQKTSIGFVLTAGLLYGLGTVAGKPSKLLWLVVGVLLGLLALTRENALVLGPVMVGWLILRVACSAPGEHVGPSEHARASPGRATPRRSDGDRWLAVVMVAAGLGFTLLPVGIHNYKAGGEFALTTFQMGSNFYMGNHAQADGRYQPMIAGRETPEFERRDATLLAEKAMDRSLTPREVSSYWLGRSLRYIASDPIGWVRLLGIKWWLTWNRYEIPDTEGYCIYRQYSSLLGAVGSIWHFGVLCPLAVLGAVLTWSRKRELALLYILAMVMAGAVALFYVFGRYRFPLVPILGIFAAAGIVKASSRVAAGRWRELDRALLIAVASAIWINWPINPERQLDAAQWGNLGAALAGAERLEEALPCFERAVTMYPGAPRLQQFLADALSLTGRHAEAIAHYRQVTRLEPRRANARYNLAVALEHEGQIEEAIENYREAVQINRSDQDAIAAITRLTGSDQSD